MDDNEIPSSEYVDLVWEIQKALPKHEDDSVMQYTLEDMKHSALAVLRRRANGGDSVAYDFLREVGEL